MKLVTTACLISNCVYIVKIRNVDVNICAHISECLLTENTYLLQLLQLKYFMGERQSAGRFLCATPYTCHFSPHYAYVRSECVS